MEAPIVLAMDMVLMLMIPKVTGVVGWLAVDNKYEPRGRGNGFFGYNNENGDGLNELNRGLRARSVKKQKVLTPETLAMKGQNITFAATDTVEKETEVKEKPVFIYTAEALPCIHLHRRRLDRYSSSGIHHIYRSPLDRIRVQQIDLKQCSNRFNKASFSKASIDLQIVVYRFCVHTDCSSSEFCSVLIAAVRQIGQQVAGLNIESRKPIHSVQATIFTAVTANPTAAKTQQQQQVYKSKVVLPASLDSRKNETAENSSSDCFETVQQLQQTT
ncbi:hypothetical protein Ccrd_025957, partial [Cynara cardunculus var. scolymus]